jgi:hypothetical protein
VSREGSLWEDGEGPGRTAAAANVYWLERRRTGQKKNDKEMGRGCANKSRGVGRVLWREDSSRGGRSTAGEGAKPMPARCSTVVRSSEHARVRSVGTVQRAIVLGKV